MATEPHTIYACMMSGRDYVIIYNSGQRKKAKGRTILFLMLRCSKNVDFSWQILYIDLVRASTGGLMSP